jgi:uncharacterized protein (DUF427 family)
MKSPGHQQHPSHRVLEKPVSQRLRAQMGAQVLAESTAAIEVDEDRNPRRFYFPRADVRMAALVPSETRSHCPFKGDARYYSLKLGDRVLADVAWSYETPYDEHAALAGRIAFWTEKIDGLSVAPVD